VVADGESARTWVNNPSERLVAEHQPFPARWRPSVQPAGYLGICSAHADGQRLDEHGTERGIRLGHIIEVRRPSGARDNGHGPHAAASNHPGVGGHHPIRMN
jgi:hypothetical protein